MEIVYTYYSISSFDIWDYERRLYFEDLSTDEHIWKVLEGIQLFTVRKVEPTITRKDYEEGDLKFKDYYNRNDKRYVEAFSDLKALCQLNYFMMRDNLYEYSQKAIFDPSHEDFDFWFALKLRQYNNKLIEIDNFLDHQLQENFDLRFIEFKRFLKLNIRQYQKELFTVEVIETANEWIENRERTKKASKQNESEVKPTKKSHKGVLNTSEISEKDQNDLLNALKPFFTRKDNIDLVKLIKGGTPNRKLHFKGNGNRFIEVFRQARLNKIINENYVQIRDWICLHFTYEKANVGLSDFDQKNVYKVLTITDSELEGHNRILIGDRKFIKDKSKIQEENQK